MKIIPAEKLFTTGKRLYNRKIPLLPNLIKVILRFFYGCDIPYGVTVGNNFRLGHHGMGVVIHPRVVIGDNVKIFQNVTIGRNWGKDGTRSIIYPPPRIGNNVRIGAGAVIIGNITIGDNVLIGANSVVLKDVPSDSTAVGVPARIIKKNNS